MTIYEPLFDGITKSCLIGVRTWVPFSVCDGTAIADISGCYRRTCSLI